MIYALVTGSLFKAPEQRTSKAGRAFTVTTIRVKDGDAWQFIRATAFSETVQSELSRLSEGGALAVTGPLKAELYTSQNGETNISLSIIADKVLPLEQQPRKREVKPSDARSRRERQAGIWQPGAGPSDPIPF
ncbi:MAG: single-stranded DNA-binding protein [Methylocella sp.]